ncbi:neurensin-1-like, partial [Scleropages formosus]|uniref:neurensin-1-like n=1 Tax=Scleropages formosus TaxID=113540 RepID=UPI000878A235
AAGGQVFGVRSYLHLFYEECTFATPKDDEEEEDNTEMKEAAVIRETWSWLLWMAGLAAGVLLATAGAVALGAGLLLPPQIEGFGDGELRVVDERAAGHNGTLKAYRAAGGLLLGLGGAVLLACSLARRVSRHSDTRRPRPPGASQTIRSVSPIHSMLPISLSQTLNIQPRSGL